MRKNLNILITGPESSGKSTLAKQLAVYLNAKLIPEFSREYLNKIGRKYESFDLIKITEKQQLIHKENTKLSVPCIFDTGALCTEIWWEDKFPTLNVPQIIVDTVKEIKYDVIFLCKPDIDWVYDPFRENPNDRDRLFDIYKSKLDTLKKNFTVVEGDREVRLKTVLSSVRKFVFEDKSAVKVS